MHATAGPKREANEHDEVGPGDPDQALELLPRSPLHRNAPRLWLNESAMMRKTRRRPPERKRGGQAATCEAGSDLPSGTPCQSSS
jgi:hypothetical protein